MDQLVEYFGMTEEGLGQLLYTTNAFIAGGAPLAVFQKRMFEDMDLDIFLRIPVEWCDEPWKQTYADKGFYYNYEALAKEKINGFLTTSGYKLVSENASNRWKKHSNQSLRKIETDDIEYMRSALSHFIKNIITYQNKEDRKIQIITLYDCSIETFMETFDLNICRLVIIGCQGSNILHNLDAIPFFHSHIPLYKRPISIYKIFTFEQYNLKNNIGLIRCIL